MAWSHGSLLMSEFSPWRLRGSPFNLKLPSVATFTHADSASSSLLSLAQQGSSLLNGPAPNGPLSHSCCACVPPALQASVVLWLASILIPPALQQASQMVEDVLKLGREAACSLPSAFCRKEASGRMCGWQAEPGPSWQQQMWLGAQERLQWGSCRGGVWGEGIRADSAASQVQLPVSSHHLHSPGHQCRHPAWELGWSPGFHFSHRTKLHTE